jgi:hypothetical protein
MESKMEGKTTAVVLSLVEELPGKETTSTMHQHWL